MASIFSSLATLVAAGQAAALCTIVQAQGSVPRHVGSKMLVYPDGRTEGTIGGGEMESRVVQAALQALQTGQPATVDYQLADPKVGDPGVCGGSVHIFIDPLRSPPTLLVVGAGHVGRAVVHLGHWLGFRVLLADDRPELCNPAAVPGADVYYPVPPAEWVPQIAFSRETYIVLTTRNVRVDMGIVPLVIHQPHAYLGIIGSRRRWLTAAKELQALGLTPAQLAQIHAPMGLELNAETPEEIALSILAEIIMLRHGGTGQTMQTAAALLEDLAS